MKYFFLIFLFFIACSLSPVKAKDNNYKKLKEIEKKLLNNQEVYLELLKVEKEVNTNLNKVKSNVQNYNRGIFDLSLSFVHSVEFRFVAGTCLDSSSVG